MENKMLELLKTRRSVRAYKPEQIQAQELDAVLEAGTYAPTGMGMQSPVIVAVQSPSYRRAVMELNQKARGMEGDPYYGAPTIVLVLADPARGTCVEDASCVLCTMMEAAHAVGLASCWIHGEREMFQLPEGKALLREWGLPQDLRGVGSLALGYAAGPCPSPRSARPATSTKSEKALANGPRKRDRSFRFLPGAGFPCNFPLEKL